MPDFGRSTRNQNYDRQHEELYKDLVLMTARKNPRWSVHVVRTMLDIPNLHTRRGFRKTHKHFADISRKLGYVYVTACARNEWHLVNAILSVLASMCTDGILCRKLLDQGIILPGLLKISNSSDEDPEPLLKLSSLIARHGSDSIKLEYLSENMLAMVTVLNQPIHDRLRGMVSPLASEFAVVAICHCYEVLYSPSAVKNPSLGALIKSVDTILEYYRRFNNSYNFIIHGLPILMLGAGTCPRERIDDIAPTHQLFCALTRSENIALRCAAVCVFLWACPQDPEADTPDPFSPLGFDASLEGFPPDLRVAMEEYGIDRCETTLVRRCTMDFLDLLRDFFNDNNLYKFGTAMTDILLRGQFVYGGDGIPDDEDSYMLFDNWNEYMPAAANVLRQHPYGSPADLDRANMLDLEYLVIMNAEPCKIEATAREVMASNPQHPYAYVIFCMRAKNREEVLQVAKRGLEVENITPCLRRRLLLVLMDTHIAKAWTLLLEATPADARRRKIGTDALLAGVEYAEVLMREAPPDSRQLMRVLDTYILNVLIARGPGLSEDLSELKPALAHLERTTRILKRFKYELPLPQRVIAHELLLRHYKTGVKYWSGFVKRFDMLDKDMRTSPSAVDETRPSHSPVYEDMSVERWWDRSPTRQNLSTLVRGPLQCSCHVAHQGRVYMGPELVEMYSCSWCATVSSLARACRGCGSAWYCDTSCQRAAWPKHKDECRRRGER
ncbi:hypothetical protein OH76DRAFT_513559 [Lentinus brumalis]|uniref:MYND-type domain-containing protein n=1 Tax=Lentinus brumalis TaxID=2498619 RepID=A0A371DB91_9APHY|nr:hypothetical protein OH76DRAFT_513559 [Polyporus brumalis]